MRRSVPSARIVWVVGVAATMAMLSVVRSAEASCDAGPGPLLWSHPTDGASDVPTNTTLWIIPPAQSTTKVLLNGIPLATADNRSFKPANLLPNTAYQVEVTFAAPQTTWRFSFTTGNGPRTAPLPRTPSATSRLLDAPPSVSETCARIATADNCYDTPPYKYVQITDAERPLLWVIRSLPNPSPSLLDGPVNRAWPASCGDPVVIGRNHPDCYEIMAVNEVGEMGTASSTCRAGNTDAGPSVDAGSPVDGTTVVDATTIVDAGSPVDVTTIVDVGSTADEGLSKPPSKSSGCSFAPVPHGSHALAVLIACLGVALSRRQKPEAPGQLPRRSKVRCRASSN